MRHWLAASFFSFVLTLVAVVAPLSAVDYEVGAEDVLHVSVTGQPEMTGDFAVDREGMLTFPLLGRIKAAGLSAPDLEKKLATLLGDGYLKRPQVTLVVKEYRSQRVFVAGEVTRPGPFALKGDRTLRALLADIGPFTAEAGHQAVVIRPTDSSADPHPIELRPETGGTSYAEQIPDAELYRVNIRGVRSGSAEKNLVLKAGDTVFVPRASQVFVTGQVSRQGPFRFEEEMTVLQALALAGGVTDRGSDSRIHIVRIVGAERSEVKASLTDIVQPGDTIVVPERFF